MKRTLSVAFLLLLLLPALGQRPAPAAAVPLPAPAPVVAMICSLHGHASWQADGGRRPAHLYDRLPEGATVEVEDGSRLIVAFSSGKRYAMLGNSAARLRRTDLVRRLGQVQALPPVPLGPLLPPISPSARPGLDSGALRLAALLSCCPGEREVHRALAEIEAQLR